MTRPPRNGPICRHFIPLNLSASVPVAGGVTAAVARGPFSSGLARLGCFFCAGAERLSITNRKYTVAFLEMKAGISTPSHAGRRYYSVGFPVSNRCDEQDASGAPFKPSFGLSGAVAGADHRRANVSRSPNLPTIGGPSVTTGVRPIM